MSKTLITIERVNKVEKHPNADLLDIVQVLGYSVVVGHGQYKVGDAAIYFPPDMLIPNDVAQDLGVDKYLKHSIYPGDAEKSQCRVSACRLRGVPSYGFLIGPCADSEGFGTDVTNVYQGKKYFPPARVLGGDCLTPLEEFHEYTDIENIQRFPNAFMEGKLVRMTEKIHGTNCRLGIINNELVAGSHRTRRAEGDPRTMYWQPMSVVEPLLQALKDQGPVIIFGEIFGQRVQDMDYGQAAPSFRAFDISVGGRYVSDLNFRHWCDVYKVPTVETLYCGTYNQEVVDILTDGDTTMCATADVRSKFKGREGIVIKPLIEQHSDILGGRLILKSVSVDYHQRKNAKDEG